MSKGGGSAPRSPDPNETAAAEARLNRPDLYNADGSRVLQGYTDANGNFVQGVTPDEFQSATKQVESDTQRQIRELLEPGAVSTVEQILSANAELPAQAELRDTSDLANTIYERQLSLLQPQIEKGEDRLLTNLQARGIPIGGEAFNDAYGEYTQETQGTLARLSADADVAARNEQSRLFGLETAQRGNSLNELLSLVGGGYTPTSGNVQPTGGQIPLGSYVNQDYQARLGQYQADQANRMSAYQNAGNIGMSLLLLCTQEAKDIQAYLDTENALKVVERLPLFVWRYKEGMAPPGMGQELHAGPMAEALHELTGLGQSDVISPTDLFGILLGAVKQLSDRIGAIERSLSFEVEQPEYVN